MNTAHAHAHAVEPSPDPHELVPVALIALEVGADVNQLAGRHADEVIHDDLGLRCMPAATASRLIREHRATRDAWAATQRQQDERRRQARAARPKVIARSGPTAQDLEEMGFDSPVAAMLAVARDEARKAGPVSPAREFLMSLGVPRRDVVTKETE